MANDAVLVTGMAGFAGAHICRHLHEHTDWDIIGLDRLNYAGTLERLAEYKGDPRVRMVFHDFRAAYPAPVLAALSNVRYIIHNGGETHVENSLHDPRTFAESNVLGTLETLNAARTLGVDHFIYVSTDEVHGPAPDGIDFKEDAPIRPSNPYSATKAGAEALAFAYWKAFRLPVTITRTMNLFGQRQNGEKYVPMCIRRVLSGEIVTVHGNLAGRVGSRKWLHARNQADALLFLLRAGRYDTVGETFHIAGVERTNLEIAQLVAAFLGKTLNYEVIDFHASRPGHDLRYSLCDDKIRDLGWAPPVPFEQSLEETVKWSVRPENKMWLL